MTIHVDILLIEGFQALAMTLLIDPLRVVNRETLAQTYSWRFLSPQGGIVRASCGLPVDTEPMDDRSVDAVFVIASYQAENALTAELSHWLKIRRDNSRLLGCIDSGALLFAEAGLLKDRPAATHHESIASYVDRFGKGIFVDRLTDFAPPRCSSAGGMATLELTLATIEHFNGADMVPRVTRTLSYFPESSKNPHYDAFSGLNLSHVNRRLAQAVEVMIGNIATPLSIADIGSRIGLTVQQLNRLFQRYLSSSPASYYRALRLKQARNLLRNSHHPVGHIATLTGFENHETFTRAYRRHYQHSPSEEREIPN